MVLSNLATRAELVYRISFVGPVGPRHDLPSSEDPSYARPDVNTFNLAWTVGKSSMLDERAHPSAAEILYHPGFLRSPDGLRLEITRGIEAIAGRPTAVICALPWPAEMRRFRLSAEFEFDQNPLRGRRTRADHWAAAVVARDGKASVTAGATVVGATHEVRGGLPAGIPLGAPAGATNVVTSPATVVKATGTVEGASPYAFALAADLDCVTEEGQSELTTNRGDHWKSVWRHAFSPTASQPKTLSYVGFGLTIEEGAGTASVCVRSYSIEMWP